MNKVIKKEYYVEFVNTEYDAPYVMQTKTFSRPSSALRWLNNNIDFIDDGGIEIYIMVMNWISEDEYEIDHYCSVIDRKMYFYPKGE